MEPLTSAPETSSFTPISVHQSRTPESFHSGPAILHYHASNCKLVALEHDLSSTPTLNALRGAAANGTSANGEPSGSGSEKEVVVEGLVVWVTSEKFLLYNTTASTGLSIPYRSISLHAIQRLKIPGSTNETEVQGLYMHITKPQSQSSYPQESDEEESLTVTLVTPTSSSTSEPSTASAPEAEVETETETQKLYAAVSACANLHPDSIDEEDQDGAAGSFASGLVFPGAADSEEGGLPPPVDGSSGWITADNMHEFFDEEGNWIGEGEGPSFPGMGDGLGPGAGSVREREGDERDDGDAGDGNADETKWRRTE
ncbi:regulator of volume decrease after cellular swelling-domain-containing protein [Aspergillus undulatus]|uniref:regulator of volume decrease after cellular swelling-domain-containing protein n=1 Tax=Aspergillus undulatus TaxID=1810928 RepID=UPI003CCE22C7